MFEIMIGRFGKSYCLIGKRLWIYCHDEYAVLNKEIKRKDLLDSNADSSKLFYSLVGVRPPVCLHTNNDQSQTQQHNLSHLARTSLMGLGTLPWFGPAFYQYL